MPGKINQGQLKHEQKYSDIILSIMDFQDVSHWQNNKIDRTKSSRMGWSDISISLRGSVVSNLHEPMAIFSSETLNRCQDLPFPRVLHLSIL